MREVTPTRSTVIELADERKLMRQGYEFLDEKRMLLASEMLQRLHLFQGRSAQFTDALRNAAHALAAAVERHGLDCLQVYPVPAAPGAPDKDKTMFLGITILTIRPPAVSVPASARAIDPSPEAKACRAAFERLLGAGADLGARAGNLRRLAREYRRTERRAKALENVLLPEVEEAIKRVDEQLDTMDREEVTRTRWAGKVRAAE
jgi:V/A-type H+-transporting ATPase subunit D